MKKNIFWVIISIIVACVLMKESCIIASSIQEEKVNHNHENGAATSSTSMLLRTTNARVETGGKISKTMLVLICAYQGYNNGDYIQEKADKFLVSHNLPTTTELVQENIIPKANIMIDKVNERAREHKDNVKANIMKHVDDQSMDQLNKAYADLIKFKDTISLHAKPIADTMKAEYMEKVHPVLKDKYDDFMPVVEQRMHGMKKQVGKKIADFKPVVEQHVNGLKKQVEKKYVDFKPVVEQRMHGMKKQVEKKIVDFKPVVEQHMHGMKTRVSNLLTRKNLKEIAGNIGSCVEDLGGKTDKYIAEKGKEVGIHVSDDQVQDGRQWLAKTLAERLAATLGLTLEDVTTLVGYVQVFINNNNIANE